MTSTTFFIIFIPILAILLLAINLILAPHNPYQEKDSVFECGFHSFLGQNRTQFSVSFFIFALLFLLFDLEILLVYPYSVSGYTNDIYGLVIMMVFFVLLTLGFIFELGKNALTIDSRQTSSYGKVDSSESHAFLISKSCTALHSSSLPGFPDKVSQFHASSEALSYNLLQYQKAGRDLARNFNSAASFIKADSDKRLRLIQDQATLVNDKALELKSEYPHLSGTINDIQKLANEAINKANFSVRHENNVAIQISGSQDSSLTYPI